MYNIEQFQALTEAIAQGATRVRYGDKEVQYRSLRDMLQLQKEMASLLFGDKKNNGRTYAEFSKGIK